MSNEEHYFENLIFLGKDCKGEPNKSALSKEVQEAIEICYYYLKTNAFDITDKLCKDLESGGDNSKWSGEIYPGEFEAMEHNGRLDALESEVSDADSD